MPVPVQRGALVRRAAPLAMMPAAAFAVHQLRYWLAFGGHAGALLHAQGHAYLHSLVPWIVLLMALAAGVFLRALGRAFAGHCTLPRYTASFVGLWLLCAVVLVAIYVAQEFLESIFAVGHPWGLAGIFGYGGWWAIPAAIAVALVLAAAFHGARWALREVAERRRSRRPRPRRVAANPLARNPARPRLAPLAGGWSGRGPPV